MQRPGNTEAELVGAVVAVVAVGRRRLQGKSFQQPPRTTHVTPSWVVMLGDNIGKIVISFPDLSPAEASVLAQELLRDLTQDAAADRQITLERPNKDAMEVGSIRAFMAVPQSDI